MTDETSGVAQIRFSFACDIQRALGFFLTQGASTDAAAFTFVAIGPAAVPARRLHTHNPVHGLRAGPRQRQQRDQSERAEAKHVRRLSSLDSTLWRFATPLKRCKDCGLYLANRRLGRITNPDQRSDHSTCLQVQNSK